MSDYPELWVACPPTRGKQKSILRKPWARQRFFTEEPELVVMTPAVRFAVHRLIHQRCLVEVPEPSTALVPAEPATPTAPAPTAPVPVKEGE